MKKRYFLMAVLTILILVAGTVYFLMQSSTEYIEEVYVSTTANSIMVAANQKINMMEYTIKYGTDIQTFYTIGKYLNEIRYTSSYINGLYILDAEMQPILQNILRTAIGEDKIKHYQEIFAEGNETHYAQDEFIIRLDVKQKDNQTAAYIMIELDKGAIEKNISDILRFVQNTALIVLLLIVGLGIIFLQRIKIADSFRSNFLKVALLILMMVVVAEITFSAVSFLNIRILLVEAMNNNINTVVDSVNRNLQFVLEKGIRLEDIYDFNGYLNSVNQSLPEIKQLYLDDRARVKAIPNDSVIIEMMKPVMIRYILTPIITGIFSGLMVFLANLVIKRHQNGVKNTVC